MMIQTLIALCALFLASFAAEAAPQVSVRAEVEVANQEAITFGDLATFTGFSDERAEELKTIKLSDVPGPGDRRVFTSHGLSQTFRSYIGSEEAGERVKFSIPNRVVVTRKAMKLSEASVKEAIIAQLKQVCESCTFKVEKLSLPIVGRLNADAKWNVRVKAELPRGVFTYPLDVRTAEAAQTYWVSGYVAISKQVLVSKRTISMGEKIGEGDFAVETRDVTLFSDSAAEEADLRGTMAARTLTPEQVIGRSALKRENAFKFGEVVKVVTGNDSWEISIDGIAQQAASVGETAKVKIPRTQKILSGVVVDKGVIEVR